MLNFELPSNENGITLDSQARTRVGREKQYAEIIERRRDGAEKALSKLLIFLTEKLGKEVTLAELEGEFGELGAEVLSSYHLAISEEEEGESINKTAHFISAISNLKRQIGEQH